GELALFLRMPRLEPGDDPLQHPRGDDRGQDDDEAPEDPVVPAEERQHHMRIDRSSPASVGGAAVTSALVDGYRRGTACLEAQIRACKGLTPAADAGSARVGRGGSP